MRLIGPAVILSLSLFLTPLATEAEQAAGNVPRIAFLAGGSRSADSFLIEAFWRKMKELGYIEGKNITAEYRFAEGVPDRLPNFAAELVRLKVDVIVAPGSGARAAPGVTSLPWGGAARAPRERLPS